MSDKDTTPRPVLVRKYGGSSLEDVARIKEVAADIAATRLQGYRLVVVVSAMGSTTNELAALAGQASASPPQREMDMLLSVGERITMSLLSMALDAEGCPAISYTGSQCAIITDDSHTDARILEVKADRVRESLADDKVVVVAGFQGVSRQREITTLGRGGSDTTAVALAAALSAERCEILKDVDGVLDADPARIPGAGLHRALTVEEMEEIAGAGSGVVHIRALEYARKHGVELAVRSSFHPRPGTSIQAEKAGAQPKPRPGAGTLAGSRENRYRPLAMSVQEGVCDLSLTADSTEKTARFRDLVLANLDPTAIVAEWLDSGQVFRWEVVAEQDAVQSFITPLQELSRASGTGSVSLQEGLTCLSFAGGRPDSWLEVQRHLQDLLAGEAGLDWRLRADGTSLRIIVAGSLPAGLEERLHAALLGR
jgi:aspartate kinase